MATRIATLEDDYTTTTLDALDSAKVFVLRQEGTIAVLTAADIESLYAAFKGHQVEQKA